MTRYGLVKIQNYVLEYKNNQNIKYIKDAFVYHHRRGSIMSHLRQIFNYGYNRTHLIKTKKLKWILSTSFQLSFYFIIFF